MIHFAHVAQRLFNTPLMLTEHKAEMIVAALADRLGIARLDRLDGSAMTVAEMNEQRAAVTTDPRPARRFYDVIDNVAWIPVDGTLVHKLGTVDPYSGMTGYDGVALKLRQASNDPDVKAIWLDFDSPGGEVSGCFDLADEIAARGKAAGGKPIWAMINEQACSAAYALACAADKVFVPRTGIAGSIGCYMLYVDWTKALDEDGIAVTFFRSRDLKARGSGMEKMDEETAAKWQASVLRTTEMFEKHVAKNRRMPLATVQDTRSDWFDADEALSRGLVDGVLSEVEAFAKLQRSLARSG